MDKVDSSQEWYVWSIKTGKFDIVSRYLNDSVPEVVDYLYPTVSTESATKKGEVRVKKTPLYSGYLFLCYKHDEASPTTWWKLNKHPFITRYVGPCTAHDLASVASMKKVKSPVVEEVKNYMVGDQVFVSSGVFKGFEGTVIGISSNSVRVQVRSLGRTIKVVFSPEDLNLTVQS